MDSVTPTPSACKVKQPPVLFVKTQAVIWQLGAFPGGPVITD